MASEEARERGAKRPRSRRFFLVRVSILLFVLFVVVVYAVRDIRSRGARREWDHTLDVAIVVVHVAGTDAAAPEALQALETRLPALEERLAEEAARHRGGPLRPFHFRLYGPVEVGAGPPVPASDGVLDLAKQALALRGWLGEIDPKAGLAPERWDSRIYVSARRPASTVRSQVEGQSEQGGRIGMVDVELDAAMADLALCVVSHELMHTLGATDKYDASGHVRVPEGLVEPERVPLYPQRFAEVMARNRPTSPSAEVIPDTVAELGVGELTAREIGWLR